MEGGFIETEEIINKKTVEIKNEKTEEAEHPEERKPAYSYNSKIFCLKKEMHY